MNLRVAITRTAPEAEATAARVRERGGEPVLAPLLTIEPRMFEPDMAGVQALLFSSANGVRAFAGASAARAIVVLAVGDATADAARAAGFQNVRSADGDVSALADLARDALHPSNGKLVHISGAHAAGDLSGALRRVGFHIERRVAYEARAAETLPRAFEGSLDIVLFHSARAAETFVTLGAPNASHLIAACLSQAVADAAAQARWARIIVAPSPREGPLLEATLPTQNAPTGASA